MPYWSLLGSSLVLNHDKTVLTAPRLHRGPASASAVRNLFRRRRQIGHQPHGNGQLVELEVGAQIRDRAVAPRLAWYLRDVDPRFLERTLRLHIERSVIIGYHVLRNPAV